LQRTSGTFISPGERTSAISRSWTSRDDSRDKRARSTERPLSDAQEDSRPRQRIRAPPPQQARDQRLVWQAFGKCTFLDRLQVLARQPDVQPPVLAKRAFA
jgi:hypothetical protein